MNRRNFVTTAALTAASISMSRVTLAQNPELQPVWAEITKRHDETVRSLQTWIRQPSIAAENRGMNEGCDLTMQMLRAAGFTQVTKVPTDGQPGIFADSSTSQSSAASLDAMFRPSDNGGGDGIRTHDRGLPPITV